MSTATLPAQTNQRPAPATLKGLLASPDFQARFREVLGERAPQFVSSILSVAQGFGSPVEPMSLIQSAMIAATLDLPINRNLGFAWLVPYKGIVQFQMGYKGYIQLALRTGHYKRMNAKCINVEAFGGYDEIGEPLIRWDLLDETKPAVGYAFAWKMVSGFSKIAYWPKGKVEAHAKRYSQSYRGKKDSPWIDSFDKMALKTVIKNELATWGMLSVQLQRALDVDQATVNADGDLSYDDNDAPRIESNGNGLEKTSVAELAAKGKERVNDALPAASLITPDQLDTLDSLMNQELKLSATEVKSLAPDGLAALTEPAAKALIEELRARVEGGGE